MLKLVNNILSSFFEKSTLKYLLVGIGTVLIDYAAIYVSYSVLYLNYIIAVIMGFVFANIFQFFSNFFFTFNLKKEEQIKKRALVFLVVILIGTALSTLAIIILESFIHSLYISKTLSLIVSFTYGFFTSKYIIYNNKIKF